MIHAQTERDGSAIVTIDGEAHKIRAASLDEARTRVRQAALEHAARTGRQTHLISIDPAGQFAMLVHPDGRIEEGGVVDAPEPETEPEPTAPTGTSPDATTGSPHQKPPERASFLSEHRIETPATRGLRGLLVRAGLRVSPSTDELAERADVRAVSQHWPGPRTIAIVNGKGGAGKTPAAILLSATLARHGGAGVVAWDNNHCRGTLGWRTEQGPHDATVLDLLPHVDQLLGPDAHSADLAHYVHHQTDDRYDVLRSNAAELARDRRIAPSDVDAIHAVAAKYYRLILIDSSNDESDPIWLRAIDHADQLVVATTTRDDHAEAGALLLEALTARNERSAQLAAAAVAIVSTADHRATSRDVQRVAAGYGALVRDVATIPFDPAIVDGLLRFEALRPLTQRAWLAAAAAVARGL